MTSKKLSQSASEPLVLSEGSKFQHFPVCSYACDSHARPPGRPSTTYKEAICRGVWGHALLEIWAFWEWFCGTCHSMEMLCSVTVQNTQVYMLLFLILLLLYWNFNCQKFGGGIFPPPPPPPPPQQIEPCSSIVWIEAWVCRIPTAFSLSLREWLDHTGQTYLPIVTKVLPACGWCCGPGWAHCLTRYSHLIHHHSLRHSYSHRQS